MPVDQGHREVTATVALVSVDSDAIHRVFTQPPPGPVVLPARGTRYLLVRFAVQCAERPAVAGFRVTMLVGDRRVDQVLYPADDDLASLTSPACPS